MRNLRWHAITAADWTAGRQIPRPQGRASFIDTEERSLSPDNRASVPDHFARCR